MFRLLFVAVIAYFSINFTLSNPQTASLLKKEAEYAAQSLARVTIKGASKLKEVKLRHQDSEYPHVKLRYSDDDSSGSCSAWRVKEVLSEGRNARSV
jgi:hypothetical protein